MRSLGFRFTVALLTTSLLAILLSGLMAQWMLMGQFNGILQQESFKRFRADVTAYLMAYGTWKNARRVENFGQFQARRQALIGEGAGGNHSRPTTEGLRANSAPRGPSNAPPPVRSERTRPPFKFLLFDNAGRVLMGTDAFKNGAVISPALRAKAEPIRVRGQVAVWAVPLSDPNFSSLDLAYFAAVRRALFYGMASAGVLALLMGLFFGSRLSAALRKLTSAIQAMRAGDLRQCVEIDSRDEIGVLACAFNQMSEQLARAHEALESSHAEIKIQAQQLKELSIRDALTGLYNRRHFDEQATWLLSQSKRYNQPLSIMIGDIDFFKRINDNFSHAAGDEVLRRVAQLLQDNTRESDLAARYGGEEFVIAFAQTELPQAAALCEKLRALIEEYSWRDIAPNLRVTMSMGLCADTDLESFEKLVMAADAQLYRAKENGRNRVCCADGVLI